MKVKEVIEKLSKFNQEAEVFILSYGSNPLEDGYSIGKVFELNSDEDFAGAYIVEE